MTLYIIENTKVDIKKDLMIHGQLVSPHMMSNPILRKSLNIEDIEPPEIDHLFEYHIELDQSPWFNVGEFDLYQSKQNLKSFFIVKHRETLSQVTFEICDVQCSLSTEFKTQCITNLFGINFAKYDTILRKICSVEESINQIFVEIVSKIDNATSIEELKSIKNTNIDIEKITINNETASLLLRKYELEAKQPDIIRDMLLNNSTKAKIALEQLDLEISMINQKLQGNKE